MTSFSCLFIIYVKEKGGINYTEVLSSNILSNLRLILMAK